MASEHALSPCYPPLSQNLDCLSPSSQDSAEQPFTIVGDSKRKKFLCNVSECQKIFRYKSEIDRHVATHSEIRPQKCTFPNCTKSFKRGDALENHIRSQHTGEAPLICPHEGCGKSFTTNAKLRYHTISHLGEKPFICGYPGCEKSFMTLSQIKQHQRSTLVHRKIVNPVLEEQENSSEVFEVIQKRYSPVDTDLVLAKKVKAEVNYGNDQIRRQIQMLEEDKEISKCGEEMKFSVHQPLQQQQYAYQQYLHQQGGFLREGEEKTFVFSRVMHDNEALKKKLELSEKMLCKMTNQMRQFSSIMCTMMQTRATREMCVPLFIGGDTGKYGKQNEIMMAVTEDVDSYFFVNNNKPEAELISDVSLTTRADSLENDSSPPKSQQDLDYFTFSNINNEKIDSI